MIFDDFLQHPHPFLSGLCESHLRMLAKKAAHVHFPAGARVIHEGSPAEHFYLIQREKVGLQAHSAGHAVPIQSIGSGEVLGWSWLFPPYCWHFDAVAEEDTDAIAFPAAQVREDCETDKTYGYALMKQVAGLLSHRLQATRMKLVQAHKG
ncbi:MAG: Crp/Fnr family transcriptional regulator [Chthoniobacteraceae bacterium]|nr:Crp/Fnr family transcriptional regulator [Chthoniobacteraceae bacterium]